MTGLLHVIHNCVNTREVKRDGLPDGFVDGWAGRRNFQFHREGIGRGVEAIPATTATTKPTATQASVTGAVPLFPDANPQVVTEVTRKIFPAVVRLDVAQEIYTEGKRNLRRGIGSGVIIDDEG